MDDRCDRGRTRQLNRPDGQSLLTASSRGSGVFLGYDVRQPTHAARWKLRVLTDAVGRVELLAWLRPSHSKEVLP